MIKGILWATIVTAIIPNVGHTFVYPCDGAPGTYHTNPDNTEGGFVSGFATVDPTVTISPDASVCDSATVIQGAIISDRAVVSGRAYVSGEVQVAGRAKVYGESTVMILMQKKDFWKTQSQ